MTTEQWPILGVESVLELEQSLLPLIRKRFGKNFDYALLRKALADVDKLYGGYTPGYLECDTPYHDLKHSLDTALVAAKIADGIMAGGEPFSAAEMLLLLLAALYHDAGYIRRLNETDIQGGALTKVHVGRSEVFFARLLLAQSTLLHHAYGASLMLHYTGYEISADALDAELSEDYRRLGKIVGTADLVSQMADRYYLERCRDALFEEFRLAGGMGMKSPDHLLEQTPNFISHVRRGRLERDLEGYYRYLQQHYGSTADPYMAAIERNAKFIERLAETGEFSQLRRDTALRTPYKFGIYRETPVISYRRDMSRKLNFAA